MPPMPPGGLSPEQIAKIRAAQAAQNKPELPEFHYTISPADYAAIRDLGRKLESFFFNEIETSGKDLHAKHFLGAIDYFAQKFKNRQKVAVENLKTTELDSLKSLVDHIEKIGGSEKIEEPFADLPEPEAASPAPTKTAELGKNADEKAVEEMKGTDPVAIDKKDLE